MRASFRDATVNWGSVTATITGDLTFDARGRPSGRLLLDIGNWPVLLAALRTSGVIDGDRAGAVEGAFGAVSSTGPDGLPRVRLPVTLDSGVAAIGPIVLGTLPPWLPG
ncbi:MAG: DUF2125 domain-containing protein [Alphaproteobacteria bacterium]|nr:MAG: DUF2125 domain-containing protein [Alphaproteobacteria bacterium]